MRIAARGPDGRSPGSTRPKAPSRASTKPAPTSRKSAAIVPAIGPSQIFQPECMAAIPPERLRTLTRLKPASSIMAAKRA